MRFFALLPLMALCMQSAWLSGMSADSLQTRQYDINEVVVTAPRETGRLRDLPAAVSMITGRTTEGLQMQAIKGVSSYVPNLFIPDYGSKITSAIYLRGIGSRMNAPAVGLYVDNMPYLDKSTFDFDFLDIERIEVLRGPQGTLYGRNSLAGLISIHTLSPFAYQGSRITLSGGTRNTLSAGFSTYQKASKTMAFSLGGRYEYKGGFFTNQYTGKKADRLYSGSLHGKYIWKISPSWQLTYTVKYENSDQGGYAYGKVDKESGEVAGVNYNEPSTYQRSLLSNGLLVEHKGKKLVVSSITSHNYFADRMFLDQDFSPLSIYTLTQNQLQNAYSQEFVVKSNAN
ncbi:MAG: TonB-dependent receptor plug domain-containing protein, partial [Bacteroidales bacterium]